MCLYTILLHVCLYIYIGSCCIRPKCPICVLNVLSVSYNSGLLYCCTSTLNDIICPIPAHVLSYSLSVLYLHNNVWSGWLSWMLLNAVLCDFRFCQWPVPRAHGLAQVQVYSYYSSQLPITSIICWSLLCGSVSSGKWVVGFCMYLHMKVFLQLVPTTLVWSLPSHPLRWSL